MGEAISSTNPPQENASGGILQEGNRPPGKDDAACQPKAQGIVLQRSTQPEDQPAEQLALQPHFFSTRGRQERRMCSSI